MASTNAVTLSSKAAALLDALAERLGLTRRETVERLITGGGSIDDEPPTESDD